MNKSQTLNESKKENFKRGAPARAGQISNLIRLLSGSACSCFPLSIYQGEVYIM